MNNLSNNNNKNNQLTKKTKYFKKFKYQMNLTQLICLYNKMKINNLIIYMDK